MRLAIAAGAAVLSAGGAIAATNYWRPAMPQFEVELQNAPKPDRARLMLIYGDNGSDPIRSGTLRPDQHVSDCASSRQMCLSLPGRQALRSGSERRQSLQLRSFNGNGNPIIGAVTWIGPAYPSRVRVACDLSNKDVGASCRVEKVTL